MFYDFFLVSLIMFLPCWLQPFLSGRLSASSHNQVAYVDRKVLYNILDLPSSLETLHQRLVLSDQENNNKVFHCHIA